MGKKLTTEQFIEKAKQVHGDKYDYSKTEYINARTKVCIICPIHGEFCQLPSVHLSNHGCPKCSKNAKLDQDSFLQKCKDVHGNFYDYSKTKFVTSHEKIIIICPIHGEFEQQAYVHIQGHGCPICAGNIKRDTNQFITEAKKIHGSFYDYSKVNYVNALEKITIICPIHGEFEQTPKEHLCRGQGCPKCAREYVKEELRLTTSEFIEKARKIHGDKYDYSKVNYINTDTKVCIICPEHGEFWQTPASHLCKRGCPKCKISHGELFIENYLKSIDINYISQYPITIDKSINSSGVAYIDFYLPDYNIFVEYNGRQHYIPIEYFGGKLNFERYLKRDNYVRDYCKDNNIKLIEIKYDMKDAEIKNLIGNILGT